MKDFLFKLPTRVIFGQGAALKLAEPLRSYVPDAQRVMVVTGPRVSKDPYFARIVEALEKKGISCAVYKDTMPEPPVYAVDAAAKALRESGAQAVVAIGGGSVIDSAKAMAMLASNPGSVREYLFGGSRTVDAPPLPLLAIPTTAGSGSEVTASSVIDDTEKGVKLSITHESLIPRCAVIDPLMHQGMPPTITAATGMDALTHAIEAYVSKNANPMSDACAEKCIALVARHLRTAVQHGENLEARSGMAVAAVLGAAAFMNGGLGAVHGISQAIGGVAHTSHGKTNAVMLPHVMACNLPGATEQYARVAELLQGRALEGEAAKKAWTAVEAVQALSDDIGISDRLSAMGVGREMFEEIVQGTLDYRLLPLNPVPIAKETVYHLLEQAF